MSGMSTLGRCTTTSLRVGAGDLGDEREKAVPEREGVAGVEPAVGELDHALEREVAEREELPHPGEMEEPVAAHLAGDPPQQQAEQDARGGDRPGAVQRTLPTAQDRARRGRDDPAARRSASVSPSPPETRNVSASAPAIAARPHASVAATPRTPSARAISQPGASTTPVASTSRR